MDKKKASDIFRDAVARLDAALSAGGLDALNKMSMLHNRAIRGRK